MTTGLTLGFAAYALFIIGVGRHDEDHVVIVVACLVLIVCVQLWVAHQRWLARNYERRKPGRD